jgi:hypothetical protein
MSTGSPPGLTRAEVLIGLPPSMWTPKDVGLVCVTSSTRDKYDTYINK